MKKGENQALNGNSVKKSYRPMQAVSQSNQHKLSNY